MARLAILAPGSLLVLWGCASAPPPTPKPPAPPRILRRVLITADVSDDVEICLQLTPSMQAQRLTLDTVICGTTIGTLRWQFVHQESTN